MALKKGDVKFKYVNTIPRDLNAGTFYWKYENGVNQLYFSPTENESDILRLDNIISCQTDAVTMANDIVLVGIYSAPSDNEQMIIDQENETVTAWSDSDWENYIGIKTQDEKYGNISEKPFTVGNVIVCGSREFICKYVEPRYAKITIGGVDYYKSRITSTACLDINGNKVEFNSSIVPGDVEVISYDVISWECFGENLSQELAKKIADFNMEINGSVTINVEESQESEGVYTLSVILKEHNPLSVVTNQQGLPEVVISKSNSDDITGEQTLMSAKQIKDTINDVIQDTTLNWIEQI